MQTMATVCGSASAPISKSTACWTSSAEWFRINMAPALPFGSRLNESLFEVSMSSAHRTAQIRRETGETKISLAIDLDGTGLAQLTTGVGFFDHMLTLLARHSLIDLTIEAHGDLHVDAHHTVEDTGICLGQALTQALGNKAGTRRYGSAPLPTDEVQAPAALPPPPRPHCG